MLAGYEIHDPRIGNYRWLSGLTNIYRRYESGPAHVAGTVGNCAYKAEGYLYIENEVFTKAS
jgi:hypothetical protein